MTELITSLTGAEIAIIGMAGRFPGAPDVDAFWHNIRNGVESIRRYTDDELRAAGVDEALLRNPAYVKAGAPLDDMEMFDAGFFGFGPREAAIMDPQHRHFLEVAWAALEHAGYDPQGFDGSIGVYGGSGMNAYMPYNLFTNPQLMESMGLFLVRHTGNDKDFLTTRVSYLLNLKGPSVNVQTACSTSLVAVHLAAQALINGECDLALAGGVTIELPHRQGYLYREDEILSPDGHCRSFDARSQGTVFGSGAGVVVLRRLEDALNNGDTIHAVIKGSAVNNDGSGKVNYFAPSVDGQADVIAEALAVAETDADTIHYVEAHGTATPIGDPIEIAALTQAFRATTDRTGYCAIGSVKSNIGHLDTAAGVAGLIKTVQALKHGELPPSLHYEQPNPAIDFARSPFYVNNRLQPWPRSDTPRRAGVSSLGVGGTNAHIVLEAAPPQPPTSDSRKWQLLVLSAKTEAALDNATANLARYMQQHPEIPLADAAYTLGVGRRAFDQRRIVVARDAADLAAAVQDRKRAFSGKARADNPPVVFMFPGGGAQYPNMGRDLYDDEPLYRETVDECLRLLEKYLPVDLKSLMFPPADADPDAAARQLEQTSVALPALFITEYALAKLWLAWGVRPAAMIGHSLGEYAAACLAGVMSLEDALRIVTLRGQLFETLPEGAMLSVSLAEADLLPLLPADLSLAAINGPELCVVSGPVEAIAAFEVRLSEQGIEARRLHIAVAAHSTMLEPILDPFLKGLESITLQPPDIPFVSNVTGDWIRPEDAADPRYWVRHLRSTVRFAAGVGTLLDGSEHILLEVGPGTTLTSLARLQAGKAAALASLRHPREQVSDMQFLLTTLGRMWLHGHPVDWDALYAGETRRRVPLPTYPFDHQRYWIEPGKANFEAADGSLTKQPDLDDWFYEPKWELARLEAPHTGDGGPLRWLIFEDERGLGRRIARRLKRDGHEVIRVGRSTDFEKLRSGDYTLNPGDPDGFVELVTDLIETERFPQRIACLWPVTGVRSIRSRMEFYEQIRNDVFHSLVFLAQALSAEVLPNPVRIGIVSDGLHAVLGDETCYPEKALLLGPCRVIPRELPDVTCQNIDIELSGDFAAPIIAELSTPDAAAVVAYRQGLRWVQSFGPAALKPGENRLREGGVYLITGGLGGIGLVMAEYLAKTVRARLVLTSRHGLPDEAQWDSWLAAHPASDRTSQQIAAVRSLRTFGAEVVVVAADVTNRQQMQTVIDTARERFGALHGVIHAAGTIDDSLISEKTVASTEMVLHPKVNGTLLLDDLLAGLPLDYVVLFSSTSAVLGLAGQVDYAAANAFLDAMARQEVGGAPTVSINWGMWRGVGMTAPGQEPPPESLDSSAGIDTGHPLLGRQVQASEREIAYLADYDPRRHWLLDEHRLSDGTALIPGTGYLEIARAALQSGQPRRAAVQIEDILFLSPLDVEETRQVRIMLDRLDDGYRFSVASRRGPGWQEHAQGRVSYTDMPAPPPVLIDSIRQRCPYDGLLLNQENYLRFGPRWRNLRRVHFGVQEALGALELPAEFRADLDEYALHPALLDMATSFGLPLIPGYADQDSLYVPLSYRRIRLYRPVPQRIWSHIRYLNDDQSGGEIVRFDITLTDEQGAVVVEIDEFVVRRIADPNRLIDHSQPAAQSTRRSSGSDLLDVALRAGIAPEEGAQVFSRVLAGRSGSQVIASSLDLARLTKYVARMNRPSENNTGVRLARPELAGAYAAPRSPVEQKLAEVWADLLGIEQVGIHDDFFDLGGHSLLAVRLFAQVRKLYGVDFSLATLFESGTIAELAECITAEAGPALNGQTRAAPRRSASNYVVRINEGDPQRPKFFCIHDLNGHVLVYRDLARHLGSDQPFYGVEAHGLNGRAALDTSIEAMAQRYLSAIRDVQPQGPYFLGGSSLGGLIAFEMAQRLHEQGEDVALLAMFDSWSPDYLARLSSPSVLQLPLPEKVSGYYDEFRSRGVAYLLERLRSRIHWSRYKLEVARLRAYEVMRDLYLRTDRTMPAWLHTYHREETYAHAYRNYRPLPYAGRITLFRALERPAGDDFDDRLGWGVIARDGVEVLSASGPHGFMVRDPHAESLAAQLRACLDAALDGCLLVPEPQVDDSADQADQPVSG